MNRTLALKVIEGLVSQNWKVLGRGGTWSGAVLPLEAYIQRKVDRAVKAEREACAKVCETEGIGAKYQGDVYAAAIRARGQR